MWIWTLLLLLFLHQILGLSFRDPLGWEGEERRVDGSVILPWRLYLWSKVCFSRSFANKSYRHPLYQYNKYISMTNIESNSSMGNRKKSPWMTLIDWDEWVSLLHFRDENLLINVFDLWVHFYQRTEESTTLFNSSGRKGDKHPMQEWRK